MTAATAGPSNHHLKALIIDDELKARENLKQLITHYCPDVEIVGEASNLQEAQICTAQYQPDILFQDICMPGVRGLEFVENSVADHEVIFVTAYDQYSLRALKAGATDYLLKPITISDLKEAILRVRRKKQRKTTASSLTQKESCTKIALPIAGGIELLSIQNILYIEADNSYCTVHTTQASEVVSRSIGKMEACLETSGFTRIHNSFLVNMKWVTRLTHIDGGTLTLENGQVLPVAKRRLKTVKEQLARQARQV